MGGGFKKEAKEDWFAELSTAMATGEKGSEEGGGDLRRACDRGWAREGLESEMAARPRDFPEGK